MTNVIINKLALSGITKDSREPSTTKSSYVQNFDILNSPFTLKPFRGMVENQTTSYYITDFLYVNGGSGIGNNILGYGVISGQGISGKPELYMKSGDLLTSGWTTALTSSGTALKNRGTNNYLFFLYKGYVYIAVGGTHIARWGNIESSGVSATLDETFQSLSYNNYVTQAIRHSKDDNMYFGVDNYIYVNDNGSINLAFTFPTDVLVTSLTEFGNYILVACKPKSGIGESIVYMWDRQLSLAEVSDNINWGIGELKIIGKVDGVPIGISVIGNSSFNLTPKIVIKKYTGGEPQVIHELLSETTSITLYNIKLETDNKIYFGASLTLNGTLRHCMFCVGKNINGEIIVTPDVNIDNDTAITNINGFNKFVDIWFVSHNSDGSVNRTVSDGTYTGTSIWESLKNPSMPLEDRDKLKIVKNVSVQYSKLPSSATISLYYRKDGDTSWTTIRQDTTDNSIFMIAKSVGTSQDQFKKGREYEFKIESSGGAEIISLSYEYEVIDEK